MSTSKNENRSVNPENIKEKQADGTGVIIDVRTPEEFAGGHLKAADLNYDYKSGEFEDKLNTLDKDKTYYLHCRSGNRSGKAAKLMKEHGFKRVHNIGGYEDLVNAGFESNK